MQRGAAEKKKEMTGKVTNESERCYDNRKGNLWAIAAPPIRTRTNLRQWVNVNAYGSCSDEGIFPYISSYADMRKSSLQLPSDTPLSGTVKPMPHITLGRHFLIAFFQVWGKSTEQAKNSAGFVLRVLDFTRMFCRGKGQDVDCSKISDF
jgi:hypothetical protein